MIRRPAVPASLASQISQVQQVAQKQVPPEPLAAFEAEQAQLREAGLPEGVAGPGTPLPDGALLDAEGGVATLAGARDGSPAVVVFYRGRLVPVLQRHFAGLPGRAGGGTGGAGRGPDRGQPAAAGWLADREGEE